MRTSKKGLELIKKFEGCKLTSYQLPGEEKYTVGYGHYGVEKGLTITQAKADEYLIKDLATAENQVNKYSTIYNFNQNQFDALVSFAYNIGSIKQLTKEGTRTKKQIGEAILLYNKSGGKVLKGLVNRRIAEQTLYLTCPMCGASQLVS
jgi:GH24 family phage-related lysozyme (muramidase)